jgi:S-formylglutathione hydrolase FrmB
MRIIACVAALFAGGFLPSVRAGEILGPLILSTYNKTKIHGRVIDHTNYHSPDNRIWSTVLQEKRCLYVYLPPGFDPRMRYPIVLDLHGITEDARFPLLSSIREFDKAIVAGRIPPMIVAVPDGHIPGSFFDSHFVNSLAGRYEDYLLYDILPFVESNYPVRPEREAHAIVGFSLSGWAAYSIALKNTNRFGAVAGIMPPLNMRWMNTSGEYRANFDPNDWGWRTELTHNDTLGWWRGIRATFRRGVGQYFGWGPEGLHWLMHENPIDLLDIYQIQPGEIAMYVSYIKHDEFNVDAQVESFLAYARPRGIEVTVDYNPCTPTHTLQTALNRFPRTIDWLGIQLGPYGPIPAYCSHCNRPAHP